MISDRELLERAARAAGIVIIGWNQSYAHFETEEHGFWNPLTDSGDALELAVLVRALCPGWTFHLTIGSSASVCGGPGSQEYHNTDPMASTRRSIVRAAAALCPP